MKTLEDIGEIVYIEGLGYAIQLYLNGEVIENEELKVKWLQCAKLMNEIENILKPYMYSY